MVRRCVWGTCNSDERYPERLIRVRLIPFPQPKKDQEKCLRWIKACGRPHHQLNVNNVDGNRNKVVCSKHFIGGKWTHSVISRSYSCMCRYMHSKLTLTKETESMQVFKTNTMGKNQKLEEIFLDKENSDPQELNETESNGTFVQSTQSSERYHGNILREEETKKVEEFYNPPLKSFCAAFSLANTIRFSLGPVEVLKSNIAAKLRAGQKFKILKAAYSKDFGHELKTDSTEFGIREENCLLFATKNELSHCSGWYAVSEVCERAGMDIALTTTK
ncbi:uncharacterized protein LOC134255507 [Saccostrea cucullata]|uniref:uncharacterized protein LOC134255507 n=1 Tax=Saccostrea cuccullata TaxID=36930 RepID=UPI002ED3B0C9